MKTSELKALNDLEGDSLRVGQKLKVAGSKKPTSNSSGASASSRTTGSSTGGSSSETTSGKGGTYKVQDGDTMYSIARKFGLSVDSLKNINGRASDTIRPGETLKLK
jgi:LysM repeat protein